MGRSDNDVRHLCSMAVFAVAMVRDPDFLECLDDEDEAGRHNTMNCLRILADAFVELMNRQGMKPMVARIPAGSRCDLLSPLAHPLPAPVPGGG